MSANDEKFLDRKIYRCGTTWTGQQWLTLWIQKYKGCALKTVESQKLLCESVMAIIKWQILLDIFSSLLTSVQLDLWSAHHWCIPASYWIGFGGSFPGVKGQLWHNTDHLSPSIAEVKDEWDSYAFCSKAPPWHAAVQLYFF